MREDLRGEPYGNPLGSLSKQEWELDGKSHRLIRRPIIGFLPRRNPITEDGL